MTALKRILLVDDSPLVLTQLTDDLGEEFEVVSAASGEEAIEILDDPMRDGVCFSNMFDLVITDLKMPGLSGYDVADHVKKRSKVNRYTPVILLTSEKSSKEEARKHGCVAYISKADKQRVLTLTRVLLSG